jgi:chromosome segregation ATPase
MARCLIVPHGARYLRFNKARFMTDTSMTPETPTAVETAYFLRRFADLMSAGQTANYLHHAAALLESLSAQVTAAVDEEQLWRYKYETVTRHADLLEAECEALKNDIDGHLDIISSTLTERDTLKAALQGREAELSELLGVVERERGEQAAALEEHKAAVAELRAGFDHERETLKGAADARGDELDLFRLASERERDELAAKLKAREKERAELRLAFDGERDELTARLQAREKQESALRLAFDRERDELNGQLKARGDELAALRAASDRECDALREKVTNLEAKRLELRAAFDRISLLKDQTVEPRDGGGRGGPEQPQPEAPPSSRAGEPGGRNPPVGETDAVVPKATLRQIRAQFEHLANEFTGVGDVPSRVMCELGALTMDMALGADRNADSLPSGDIALSILATPALATAETV